LRWKQQVGLAFACNALGGREPAERIEPEARDVVHRPYMPGEPRQADFRRRQNLDLVPKQTELSRDLTGGEPGPFGEQNAHGGGLCLDSAPCRYKTEMLADFCNGLGESARHIFRMSDCALIAPRTATVKIPR